MDSVESKKILLYLHSHQADMVAMLTRLIELETPSDHKPSLDHFGQVLANETRQLGAGVQVFQQEQAGNHVCARWGEGAGGALLLCHMDTVWDLGTVAGRPVRIEGDRLFGPGAEDMKGGIVVALWAIRALAELGLALPKPVTLLLTSDEEVGSTSSRPIIEHEARQHQVVFVLEPAQPPLASYKTFRKGIGDFRVSVTGRAAHAGADHEKGINAIDELAYQILTMRGWTDYGRGTTFNVGLVGGGTRSNVVPAAAWAEVDVRVTSLAEAERVSAAMQGLVPHFPGSVVEVTGGFNRPPMERTPATVRLFQQAQALAAGMGIQLTEAAAGGGSDGNLTSAIGIPTLDGMGVAGDGGHAVDEYAVISSLPERAAVLAAMLRTL